MRMTLVIGLFVAVVAGGAFPAGALEVSIRDGFLGENNFDTPAAGMRHLGLTQVEVALERDFTVRDFEGKGRVSVKSDAEAKAFGATLARLGLKCCGLLTACDFSAGEPEENVAWVARAIEIAGLVGAPAVRIDSAMKRERELDFETRVNIFADNLSEVLKRTADSPVTLGIENHGFQGNNLAFLLNVYQRVGSERLGSTLDTGNFYWRGYPLGEVYGILRVLAPHAKHTHFKNINYPEDQREVMREAGWKYDTYFCALEDGDIETAKVARMLLDAGYQGTLCIEDESVGRFKTREERVALLERNVAHMKTVVEGLK